MDYNLYLLYLILILFGFLSIKFDLKTRKVPNLITFSFLGISFIYFLLNINNLIYFDFIILFISIFLSFHIYKKHRWGAADGKIFIGLLLLLTSYKNSEIFLRFVLNVLIIYLFTILILTMISTSRNDKIIAFKEMDITETLFSIILILLVVRILFFFIPLDLNSPYILLLSLILILILIDTIKKYIKKKLHFLSDIEKQVIILLIFIFLFLFWGYFSFIYSFVILLLIRFIILFVSELSIKIKQKGIRKYESPFTIYLFFASLFTVLTNKSIIEIIVLVFL